MTQKSIAHLGLLNTAPIVRDPDKGYPAILNLHRDSISPRVNGVFHQLLHHTGRPLHHLTRSNLIYRLMIQNIDLSHISPFFRLSPSVL